MNAGKIVLDICGEEKKKHIGYYLIDNGIDRLYKTLKIKRKNKIDIKEKTKIYIMSMISISIIISFTLAKILNNNIVSTSKILAALKSEKVPDVPIYMAKTKNLEDKLMQFAPIEEVYIRRYAFPARLQIIVREREPFISISPDVNIAPIAFFTRDGKLIGREYLPLKKDYKTLKVLSYGNKGDDYSKWDVKKLLKIENLAKYIETYSKEPVEYVDLRNPEDVYVKIKSVNIRLGRLDENVYERIKRIPSIIPQIQLMDSKIKYLDLRWKDTNYLKLDE